MTADPIRETTEGAEPIRTTRAVLKPSMWCVECPACGVETDIVQTREDDAGAFHADGTDQFFHCPECGEFLEVVAASVQEAYPA